MAVLVGVVFYVVGSFVVSFSWLKCLSSEYISVSSCFFMVMCANASLVLMFFSFASGTAGYEEGVEEYVRVDEPHLLCNASEAFFSECGSVKSTSSFILMESNRLDGAMGSRGVSSILFPCLVNMTLLDFQLLRHSAGIDIRPWRSIFLTTISSISISFTN